MEKRPTLLEIFGVTLVIVVGFGLLGGILAFLAGHDQAVHLGAAIALAGIPIGSLSAWLARVGRKSGGLVDDGSSFYIAASVVVAALVGTGAVIRWGWPLWTAPMMAVAGFVAGLVVASLWALILYFLLLQIGIIEVDPATNAQLRQFRQK